jgi:hypothetical protein
VYGIFSELYFSGLCKKIPGVLPKNFPEKIRKKFSELFLSVTFSPWYDALRAKRFAGFALRTYLYENSVIRKLVRQGVGRSPGNSLRSTEGE